MYWVSQKHYLPETSEGLEELVNGDDGSRGGGAKRR